jgi:hypothetical protein
MAARDRQVGAIRQPEQFMPERHPLAQVPGRPRERKALRQLHAYRGGPDFLDAGIDFGQRPCLRAGCHVRPIRVRRVAVHRHQHLVSHQAHHREVERGHGLFEPQALEVERQAAGRTGISTS